MNSNYHIPFLKNLSPVFQMAALDVDVILCGICDAKHATHVADYWCPECDEGLCSTCKNYHGVSKTSRQHGVISIDDYKKLPAEICKIEQNCREHDKKFQMFCPHHDKLCCIICISENHKECTGMFLIDDAINSLRSSPMFDSLEKSLKDIQDNIEKIVKDREANLVEIKQQHFKSLNDIKETRQKINSRLDELEKIIIYDLNSTETQLKLKIETLLNKLSEKNKMIEILRTNLMSVKQHGSDLQAFIGGKMLEKDVTNELNYVKNLSEKDGFSQLDLKCQIDDKITDILSKCCTFGSVRTDSSPSSIIVMVDHEKQAQVSTVVPPSTRSINDITVSPSGTFQIQKRKGQTRITGSSAFPDGRFIFADCFFDRRLVIIQSDGTFDTELSVSPLKPFDVTCIDDTTVAVTTFSDNKILIVDTENKKVTTTIETGRCRGITYRQGQILYCEIGKGIVGIQLSNYKVCTLVNDHTIQDDFSYITNSGENIYYTDYGSSVKCYSISEHKRSEYKNESIMNGVAGIAVDQHGIVYVISNNNKSVVLISEDSKNSRTLLSAKDGIMESYRIQVHTNKLYSISSSGVIRIFDIA